jgi:serine/threonine protein kinase
VLRVEELSQDLLRRTLDSLREVCGERAVLPDTCVVPRQLSKLTTEPHAESAYAEIWKGRTSPGEGVDSTLDVCIKVIKSKRIHKVGGTFDCWGDPLDNIPQEFRGEVAIWVKLNHPNILRCFGIKMNPLQIVMEWMPNGQAMGYVQNNEDADRVSLVNTLIP